MSFVIAHDAEKARKSLNLARKVELLLWRDWIDYTDIKPEDLKLLHEARERAAALRKSLEAINASMSADLGRFLEATKP